MGCRPVARSHTDRRWSRPPSIAELAAHGDRPRDGPEVISPSGYAEVQLGEIVYAALLISTPDNGNNSAFHTPTRRAAPHEDSVMISKKLV